MERETITAAMAYLRGMPWSEVKVWLDLVLYYGILITALFCLVRLKTIQRVITEFNKGRGPLWNLRSTVEELKDLEPKLKDTINQVSTLTTQMAELKDQVEALSIQLKELQLESVSHRTGDAEPAPTPTPPAAPQAVAVQPDHGEEAEERNWELLRDYWRRNTRRLEHIIDQIPDGRVKGAFDRLPRTNYTRIIHKLQGQGRISAAVAKASKDLVDEFNRYRPRNRSIPDEVVQGLDVLDGMLDRELVAIATIDAAEEAEDAASTVAPPSVAEAPAVKPNGATTGTATVQTSP